MDNYIKKVSLDEYLQTQNKNNIIKKISLDEYLQTKNKNDIIKKISDSNKMNMIPEKIETIDLTSRVHDSELLTKQNDSISNQFTKPDTNKPINIYDDDGNITHLFNNKNPVEVSNGNYEDIYNDLGKVTFSDCKEIEIPVEQGPARILPWNWGLFSQDNKDPYNNVCDTLSGACENEKYRIISFKSDDDSLQRIKIYDKKTNELVKEFTTNKLGHSNGLTIDGDTVYVANAEKKDDYTKLSRFRLSEALSGDQETFKKDDFIKSETFQVMTNGKIIDEGISGISHDEKNNDTSITAAGNDIYISRGDGTYIHTTKMIISDDQKANGIAGTTQDICVAKNKMYVIRTKNPNNPTSSYIEEGCNMIDIYDTNGKYIGSKTIDLPGTYLAENNNPIVSNKQYRELESISYDPSTDSFSLYYTSPNYGWNSISGNTLSPPHVVVTGVKFGI